MPLNRNLLEAVADRAKDFIRSAESLHLASIAKALESKFGCRIFMRPFPRTDDPGDAAGCLLTCETSIIHDKGEYPLHKYELLPSRDHFIFYRVQTDDPEASRWAIGHELGHVLLHWPLGKRQHKLIWAGSSENRDGYMVEYGKSEESEADAFACLIAAHRPKPIGRKSRFVLDEAFFEKVKHYRKRGYFQSDKM